MSLLQTSDASTGAGAGLQRAQLRKRRSDADEDLRVRAAPPSPFSGHTQSATAPAVPLATRNPLELRAFGLEDRADAVISSGAADWSLNKLAQWRQEMAHHPHAGGAEPPANSKAYIAQRQREFKQQMLRASRAPSSSQ